MPFSTRGGATLAGGEVAMLGAVFLGAGLDELTKGGLVSSIDRTRPFEARDVDPVEKKEIRVLASKFRIVARGTKAA